MKSVYYIVLSHNVSLMRKCKYFCHARNYVEYGVGWGMGGPNIPPFWKIQIY